MSSRFLCRAVYYTVQGVIDEMLKCDHSNEGTAEQYCSVVLFTVIASNIL